MLIAAEPLQQAFHLRRRQRLQNVLSSRKNRLPLEKAALRQHLRIGQEASLQHVLRLLPSLPPDGKETACRQRPELVDLSHAWVSMRLEATTVIFSATMALSWPSSWMVLHSQPL